MFWEIERSCPSAAANPRGQKFAAMMQTDERRGSDGHAWAGSDPPEPTKATAKVGMSKIFHRFFMMIFLLFDQSSYQPAFPGCHPNSSKLYHFPTSRGTASRKFPVREMTSFSSKLLQRQFAA